MSEELHKVEMVTPATAMPTPVPKKEDLEELDMESFCLPGLGKGQTNAVFNSLQNLCRYMYDFFEAKNDGKDFVYCQKCEETGEVIKVTIHREK